MMVSPVLFLGRSSLRATTKSTHGLLQLPPDDCILLKGCQHLSHWSVLTTCCLAQWCLTVSLCSVSAVFVSSLGTSALPSAACCGGAESSQGAQRSLPVGGKALCSATIAPFPEPAHLNLDHCTIHYALAHRLSFCFALGMHLAWGVGECFHY